MMRVLMTCAIVFALCAGAALAADVTGTWKASVPGREGAMMETTFTLKAEGAKLTGTVSNQWGDTEISDGKVAGDNITFKVKREFGDRTMIMVYEGAVAGNEIKFKSTVEGMDRPPREFVAKKSN